MNRLETLIFVILIVLACGIAVMTTVRNGCPAQEKLFIPVYVWGER